MDSLGLLPSGAMAYYGHQIDQRAASQWSREFAQLAYGADSANAQKINVALDAMNEAGPGQKAAGISLSAASGLSITSLQQAEHPEKLNTAKGQMEQATEAKTPILR